MRLKVTLKASFKFMIQATSTLFVILAALHGGYTVNTDMIQVSLTPTAQVLTLEDYVREYYKDTPILAEISKCESTFMQYDSNGKPVRGKVNKSDIGVMQINEYYHNDTAKRLGYDLSTVDGNLAYAKYLYNKEGVDPWSSSSKCWSKSAVAKQLALR